MAKAATSKAPASKTAKSSGVAKSTSSKATKSSTSASTTIDHEEIRRWVEERGGSPACVCGTGGEEDTGLIRIDFPGYSGKESLKHIEWEDWFEKFEEKKLAFLHQDEKDGKLSRFSKLVSRSSSKG